MVSLLYLRTWIKKSLADCCVKKSLAAEFSSRNKYNMSIYLLAVCEYSTAFSDHETIFFQHYTLYTLLVDCHSWQFKHRLRCSSIGRVLDESVHLPWCYCRELLFWTDIFRCAIGLTLTIDDFRFCTVFRSCVQIYVFNYDMRAFLAFIATFNHGVFA